MSRSARPESGGGGRVVVVGSLNLDLVVRVERHPRPGETVLASDHFRNPGGKGANQAVAAARLGARVAMVGRVGGDPAGAELRAALVADRVDGRGVAEDQDAPTGTALITVADDGENTIVVAAGANARVGPDDVERHGDLLDRADVCLLQHEVPEEAVAAAARRARGTVVLNPAPARQPGEDLLDRVDVLVPNQTELAHLAGAGEPPGDASAAEDLARRLGLPRVVVTLGGAGALVVDGDHVEQVQAPRVEVVDTTAAGDAFCGALAQALADGAPLRRAVRWAVAAGACAVRSAGAQRSLPRRGDVEALIGTT